MGAKKDTVDIKNLLMGITVISGVAFIVSLVSAHSYIAVFTASFSYLSSNALAFYASEAELKVYKLIINCCYGALLIMLSLLIVDNTWKSSEVFCLFISRILLSGIALLIVCATVYENVHKVTKEQKDFSEKMDKVEN